ncbi:hypothetical protein FNQ90_18885 [Streptomyces alkaliphilus]|uniref:Uncharacterized protein n=1 Tax=Streptomyces alkaliphilus TaxID=1472722 RepID=A0A7W3Y380_9ACTN|nr:hypothetical protein [Streptomyces alkaliphilus]
MPKRVPRRVELTERPTREAVTETTDPDAFSAGFRNLGRALSAGYDHSTDAENDTEEDRHGR